MGFILLWSASHTDPPLGPQHRVPEPVPSLETRLKSE